MAGLLRHSHLPQVLTSCAHRLTPLLLPGVLHHTPASIDIPGMFEAKGVSDAAGRLTLVVGDVRKPFPPAAQQAQVRAACRTL
jgi:hypothetical protein